MDYKQIQELIRQLNKSNIAEFKYETDAFKVTIRTNEYHKDGQPVAPIMMAAPQQYMQSAPLAPVPIAPAPLAPVATAAPAAAEESKLLTIKSPMVGTFYRSAGPGKPVFMKIGDAVSAGSVVCIVEAMKLFNEIESDVAGTIVKILVDDASPIEYDQPLFLVEPK